MKKMTAQEFEEACNEFGYSWDKSFSVEWTTGGNRCDCWGGNYPVTPQAPEELHSLDRFLTKYFPTISFMQYKGISMYVESKETYDCDYYGGRSYGVKKEITYANLQKALEDLDLLLIVDANVE